MSQEKKDSDEIIPLPPAVEPGAMEAALGNGAPFSAQGGTSFAGALDAMAEVILSQERARQAITGQKPTFTMTFLTDAEPSLLEREAATEGVRSIINEQSAPVSPGKPLWGPRKLLRALDEDPSGGELRRIIEGLAGRQVDAEDPGAKIRGAMSAGAPASELRQIIESLAGPVSDDAPVAGLGQKLAQRRGADPLETPAPAKGPLPKG